MRRKALPPRQSSQRPADHTTPRSRPPWSTTLPLRLFVLMAIALAGCRAVPVPELTEPDWSRAEARWAGLLKNHVDAEGRIDFAAVRDQPGDLHAFVGTIAEFSPWSHPERFPSIESQRAYAINSYNALAIHNTTATGVLPSSLFRFFIWNRVTVGGIRVSLYEYENEWIRPLGDPRLHFALNCLVRSCPRLPQEVFRPDTLDSALERATVEFLNDERHVSVDDQARVIRLSAILDWYEEDFLVEAASLIDYVQRYRQELLPEGYEVEFLPYDWTRNDAP